MDTELETMVVKVLSEVSQYMLGMKQVQDEAQKTAKHIEDNTSKVAKFTSVIEGYGDTLRRTLSTVGISLELKGLFEKFEDYERNVRRLNVAIETNGHNVKSTVADYLAFSKSLTETTTLTKGTVMGLMRQVEGFGLSGEAAKKATGDALKLSAATDVGAEAALRLTVAMAKGDSQTAMLFARMIPQLRQFHGNAAGFAEQYAKLVSAGMKTMEGDAKSLDGRIEILGRTFNDLKRQMGGMIAEGVQPAVSWLEKLARSWNELDPVVKSSIGEVLVWSAAIIAVNLSLPLLIAQLKLARTWWMLLAEAILAASKYAHEMAPGTKQARKEAEETTKDVAKITAEAEERTRSMMADVSEGGITSLHKLDDALKENADLMEAQIKRMNELVEEKNKISVGPVGMAVHPPPEDYSIFGNKRPYGAPLGPESGALRTVEQVENDLKRAQAAMDEYTKRMEELKKKKLTADMVIGGPLATFGAGMIPGGALGLAGDLGLLRGQKPLPPGLGEDIKKTNEELRKQITTFGMSAEQIKHWEFIQRGASAASLELTDALVRQHRQQEESKKDYEEVGKLLDEFQPERKYQAELARLNHLMTYAGMPKDVYSKAVNKATLDYVNLAQSIEHASGALQSFQAVGYGTAEAAGRIAEFQDRMADGFKETAKAAEIARKAMPTATGTASLVGAALVPGAGLLGTVGGLGASATTGGAQTAAQERANEILAQIRDKASVEIAAASLEAF